MISFKKYVPSILIFSLVISAACYFVYQRAYSTLTLRWAHVYEVSSPYHQQAVWAAKEFERRTRGRYTVKVYPASSLGNEVSINEAVNLGSIDIIHTGVSLAAQRYGPLAISDYPYAIKDFDHWLAFKDSDFFEQLTDGYQEATGDEIVSLIYYGFRHVASNKPIQTPDDMRNLKIRVPNALPFMVMPQQTGANPTPIPFAEAYLALQQGVVEAIENPLTTIKYKRFYEVQSHINLTGHIANSVVIIVAGKTLSRIDNEDGAVLRQVINEAAERTTQEVLNQELSLLGWYTEKGITIVDSDREAFREKVLPALTAPGLPFTEEQLMRLQQLAADDNERQEHR